MKFEVELCNTQEEVRKHIQDDEGKCVQQVAYSTYHDALTQINFSEKIIRTNHDSPKEMCYEKDVKDFIKKIKNMLDDVDEREKYLSEKIDELFFLIKEIAGHKFKGAEE